MPSSSMRIIGSSSTTRICLTAAVRASGDIRSPCRPGPRCTDAHPGRVTSLGVTGSGLARAQHAKAPAVWRSISGHGIVLEGDSPRLCGEVTVAADQAADEERMGFQLALRRRGISDQAVLRAMDEVPREYFVAADLTDSAYADQALPIACAQTISQPLVAAYMPEQLEVEPQHRVLEVGTGSGYQAAILSRLAREVVSLERYRTLADAARQRIKTLGYANVTVV